ncbi:hypothetical protein PENSUB_5516 [Penicillium subrubescens]|uniref:Uncharacterized protein n=1 Tax=Penicillium subrubescens TaxID=1316194 RepID=A0A1Q5U813_9EURO|nr:hypothetical protein PENSUB_5516 [Penicillium subrubescens]
MSIPRELVFENKDPPADAPDVFEYVGVQRDWEKWKAERKRMWKEAEKNRPPLPRDSWFERTYPIGTGIKDSGNTLILAVGLFNKQRNLRTD